MPRHVVQRSHSYASPTIAKHSICSRLMLSMSHPSQVRTSSGAQPAGSRDGASASRDSPGERDDVDADVRQVGPPETPSVPVTLERLREDLSAFARQRDWEQFHTPRNLVLALVGEVGELAECFQWHERVSPGLPELSSDQQVHVAQELADVLLYLVRLSDACGIDLGRAALEKMQANAVKYPVDQARGRADKYTAYAAQDTTTALADDAGLRNPAS